MGIWSTALAGVWMGTSSAAVAAVLKMDASKWVTINRLVEVRYIAAVVRALVKAVWP